MHGKSYVYCANSLCPGLSGEGTPYAALQGEARACPECGAALRSCCPGCGRVLDSRPLHYCPACGCPLHGGASVREGSQCPPSVPEPRAQRRECRICGRPVLRRLDPRESVTVCSDVCLAQYMIRYVRTCDGCGKRFSLDGGSRCPVPPRRLEGPDGVKFEFCSEKCLETFRQQGG